MFNHTLKEYKMGDAGAVALTEEIGNAEKILVENN
jgi:hypothetical protein